MRINLQVAPYALDTWAAGTEMESPKLGQDLLCPWKESEL
jgi:hypothetical protein